MHYCGITALYGNTVIFRGGGIEKQLKEKQEINMRSNDNKL